MTRLNMRNTINKTRGTINSFYDMTFDNLNDIRYQSRDLFTAISDSFTFGYAQGMKAAKAEMKKKGSI